MGQCGASQAFFALRVAAFLLHPLHCFVVIVSIILDAITNVFIVLCECWFFMFHFGKFLVSRCLLGDGPPSDG
jgi:hypothetical protein